MSPQKETVLPVRDCVRAVNLQEAHLGHVYHIGGEGREEYLWCTGFAWSPLTREELISICEAAVVPQDKWSNRDTPEAQRSLGKCWVYLKAGCKFWVITEKDPKDPNDRCVTDNETIWVRIQHETFNSFEIAEPEDGDKYEEKELFYLPTRQRLKRANRGDWY